MKATRAKPAASRNADAYLHRLGERVRTLRNQRGMTRKALAQHARVSERYLAQLEAGLGNCSIVLLRRIARAIGLPVTQLVHDGAEPPLDLVLLTQFLERRSGANLSEIFDMFGQETFRRAEREALDDVLRRHPHFVIATSGSIVTEPGTLELLLASCFTIWVRAEPEEHMKRVMAQGDMRPMANNARAMEDLVSILKSREPLYAKAEAVLATTGKTPEQNLAELLRVIAVPATSIARRSA